MTVDVILPCLNEAPALPWILDRMPTGFRPIIVGAAVQRVAFHHTRWRDGRVLVWLGARRGIGRGERSSGLQFDLLAAGSSQ